MTDTDTHAEGRAREFAVRAHADQRYGDGPYVVHLEAVRRILAEFDYGGALGVAAWLHDVVEDTTVTRDEVAALFGDEVAALVWAVTGVGGTRPERNEAAYAKIRAHPQAAVLKLADRIANVEASTNERRHLDRYRSEAEGFEAALFGLGDPAMWIRLRRALGLGTAGSP